MTHQVHYPAATANPAADVLQRAQREGRVWEQSAYYEDAEKWTFLFWSGHLPFRRLFDQLDITHLVELACGRGRHSEYVMRNLRPKVRTITCLDLLASNVDSTARRLAEYPEVSAHQNDGVSFRPVAEGAATAVFCYDAMVHFDENVILSYLRDLGRVLVPGGKAVFHHSNYAAGKGILFGKNPHARAYLSRDLFAEMARSAGLEAIEQPVIPWGLVPELDCVSLVGRSPHA